MWWRQTFAVIVGQQFWPFTNRSSNELHAVFTFYLFYTLLRCLPHFIVSCTSSLTSSWVVAVLAKDLCSTRLRTMVLLRALPFVTFLKTCCLWLVWKCHDVGHAVYVFLWFTLPSPPPPPPCLHPLFYITVSCHTLQTISIQQCGFRVLLIFAICCLPHDLLALTGWEVHDVPVLLWFTLAPPCIHPLLYIMVALLCKCFCPLVWEEGVDHFAICCPPQNLLVLTGLEVHDVHVLLPPHLHLYHGCRTLQTFLSGSVRDDGVAHFAICHLPGNLLALTGLQVHDVPFTFLVFWGESFILFPPQEM